MSCPEAPGGSAAGESGVPAKRAGAIRAVALVLIAAGALALRVPDLGNRPMHADEAVHAFKTRELWEHGAYRYDPDEFHGPTLYYAALPILHLRGRRSFAETTEGDYRLAPALFGVATVLLPALLADGIGWPAALLAGVLMAVSPSLAFYSRYAIQETLLLFFTLMALASGWRWARGRRTAWAVLAGASVGLMFATKETAAVALAAAAVALAVVRLRQRSGPTEPTDMKPVAPGPAPTTGVKPVAPGPATERPHGRRNPPPSEGRPAEGSEQRISYPLDPRSEQPVSHPLKHLLAAVLAAVAVAALFLSGFGSNVAGPVDLVRSYLVWGERAGGTDLHRHSWHYYLGLIAWARRGGPAWSEGFTLALAAVSIAIAFRRRSRADTRPAPACEGREAEPDLALAQFLGLYTLGLAAAYSLIPYKTPWCVAGMVQGLALSGGIGGAALLRAWPRQTGRAAALALLAAGAGHLGWQAWRASYLYAADGRNPYVYSETAPDVLDMAEQVEGLMQAAPARDSFAVQVLAEDEYYWPLPWYLRRIPNIGFWARVPEDLRAPVILASSAFAPELSRRLADTHTAAGYYGLRSGAIYQLWVCESLWQAYIHAPRKRRVE